MTCSDNLKVTKINWNEKANLLFNISSVGKAQKQPNTSRSMIRLTQPHFPIAVYHPINLKALRIKFYEQTHPHAQIAVHHQATLKATTIGQ
uniref:Uncharacterized protein n=1 Tax=Rhizophora mucronata TaxID=61149 RepID=A0A2P2LWY4_RHIMU